MSVKHVESNLINDINFYDLVTNFLAKKSGKNIV